MADFTLNYTSQGFTDSLDIILKVVGGFGAFVLFFIGFRRYNIDQRWKRNEFLANEIKEFKSDIMVQNAMYIIDWGERYIELFPAKQEYKCRFAKVDRDILVSALTYHELKPKKKGESRFSEEEVAIRDTFDRFLSYFERFEQLILSNLITTEELKPYIDYWVVAITTELEEQARETLYNFINEYRYYGTQNLFARYCADIAPKIKARDLVKVQNSTNE